MDILNEMRLDFPAIAENEGFARMVVSGFMLPLNPTLEELADVKTAVSEAVTNAIIHGYGGRGGTVRHIERQRRLHGHARRRGALLGHGASRVHVLHGVRHNREPVLRKAKRHRLAYASAGSCH